TISGINPVPARAPSAEIKPTIAEALRETADAVQEAVRELTGKNYIGAPVTILQPTAEQIRAADEKAHTVTPPGPSGPGVAAVPPGVPAPGLHTTPTA